MGGTKRNKTSFKKGHKVSLKMRKKISIKTKEAMKNPLIRKKLSILMKKRLTKKERKRLSQIAKGRKHTLAYKKYMSKIMKGRATKWLKGKPSNSKGHHLTEEHKNKLRTAIQKHHIDLNKENNKKRNLLYLSPKIHQYLHKWAYRYLVEIGQIKAYMKWFENRLNIKLIKTRGWDN